MANGVYNLARNSVGSIDGVLVGDKTFVVSKYGYSTILVLRLSLCWFKSFCKLDSTLSPIVKHFFFIQHLLSTEYMPETQGMNMNADI